jgi:alanine racemase
MGYINLDKKAFLNNASYYGKLLGSKDKICIALKDNAYGHGIDQIAKLSSQYGIKHCMVRDIDEANIASSYGFETILILYEIPKTLYPSSYIFSVNSVEDITKYPKDTKIELKLDTGMSRNGILSKDLVDTIKLIEKQNLNLNGIFTHFCCADEDDNITKNQEDLFIKMYENIRSIYSKSFRVHCANSAGVHKVNNSLYDIARIGIGLYGYLDIEDYSKYLQPVLSLHANKISTRVLQKNDCINYGATYKVPKDNFVVSNYDIGYSDGFFRLNERKKASIENGKDILGRVSMDSLTVQGDADTICIFKDARKLAAVHDTLHYEILTHLHRSIKKYIV